MKLLTIVIPCYNSENYLLNCVNSFIDVIDERVEVLIVNDGSKDNTSKIAHEIELKNKYIRVIDKENGGHGSSINIGIREANGLYLKILDSDDKLNKENLIYLLNDIENKLYNNDLPDVYLTDYVSVNITNGRTTKLSLSKRFKKKCQTVKYREISNLKITETLMIHMFYVKVSMLRNNKVEILEKTFYEDNQFVCHTLLLAETFCYLNKPIYYYSVGRIGQSVSLDKMIINYNYQLNVINACIDLMDYSLLESFDRKKRKIILHQFIIFLYLTYFYCYLRTNKIKKNAYKTFIYQFKQRNNELYKRIFYRSYFIIGRLVPVFLRGPIVDLSYRLFGRYYGFI